MVSTTTHVANFIVLIAKQFIYRQRCLGEKVEFNHLRRIILSVENIEKYIAVKQGKIKIHAKKWNRKELGLQFQSLNDYVEQYNLL